MSKKKFDLQAILQLDIKDLKKHFRGENQVGEPTQEKPTKTKKKKNKIMTEEVVVFDIGSTTIQGVVGRYQKNRLTIKQVFEATTPHNCLDDGKILDEKRLASTLANLMIKHNVKTKKAIITMNSSQIINRELFIPVVQEDERETVIRYELQQYLPINLQEYQIRYLTSQDFDGDGRQRVFVSVFPERMLRSYYETLQLAHLQPYALELPLIAIRKLIRVGQRAQIQKNRESQNTIAFLDLGQETMNIMIYHEGEIDFTRLVKSGSYLLDEALRREGINNEKLREYKAEVLDLQVPTLIEKHPDFKQKLDQMMSEVDKFMQFYQNTNQDKRISQIYTYGGCSQIKGMQQYISETLKIPAEVVQKLDQFELSGEVKQEQKLASYFNAVSSLVRVEE